MRPLHGFLVTAVGIVALSVGCSRHAAGTSSDAGGPFPGIPEGNRTYAPRPSAPVNALPVPSASVDSQVNPAKLPVYNGPTGVVEGTVLVRGPDAPELPGLNFKNCPAAIDTYAKLFRAGPARADGARPVADAIIAITGYSGYYLPEPTPAHAVVIGTNCGYRKRTLAMTFGQRLEVTNQSKLPFAPALDGVFQPAVMMAPPLEKGDPVKIYPPEPGHYMLIDQLQPFVHEDLFVLRQPLHDVTDLGGRFRIEGVPTGNLKIGTELRAVGRMQKDITVRANVVENVEFVLTYAPPDGGPPAYPSAPKNLIP